MASLYPDCCPLYHQVSKLDSLNVGDVRDIINSLHSQLCIMTDAEQRGDKVDVTQTMDNILVLLSTIIKAIDKQLWPAEATIDIDSDFQLLVSFTLTLLLPLG
jgi:hypothetical protein